MAFGVTVLFSSYDGLEPNRSPQLRLVFISSTSVDNGGDVPWKNSRSRTKIFQKYLTTARDISGYLVSRDSFVRCFGHGKGLGYCSGPSFLPYFVVSCHDLEGGAFLF